MRKRRQTEWISKPGGFDHTHCYRRAFPITNQYGFPQLQPARFEIEDWREWVNYKDRDDSGKRHSEAICHFFLDDNHFETVWQRPDATLNRIRRFWATMTPDFSMFVDFPLAAQIWNKYRMHWTGAYWQEQGIRVIPTVNWADRTSWDWCFLGLPMDSIVAIAPPDTRRIDTLRRFRQGFNRMVEHLQPRLILCYGKLPFHHDRCIEREPDWVKMRRHIQRRS